MLIYWIRLSTQLGLTVHKDFNVGHCLYTFVSYKVYTKDAKMLMLNDEKGNIQGEWTIKKFCVFIMNTDQLIK